jgi:phage tail sheath protein FI
MPVAPTYPGVYVEEIPSGVHPITGVPTAIGAFIGWFPKGTLDTAVELLSFADVEREYGGLHKDSDTSFALAQFFLNGGGRAWGVRVAAIGAGATKLGAATAAVPKAGGGGNAFSISALNEGAWGNAIRVQVVGPDAANRFDLIVMLTGTQNGRTAVVQQERFSGLTATTTTDPSYLPLAVNGVSKLIKVIGTGANNATYATPAGSGITSTGAVNSLASKPTRQVDVTVGGGAAISVTLPGGVAQPTGPDVAATLQSAIRTAKGGDPVWAQAAVVSLGNGDLQVLPGVGDSANVGIAATGADTTAADLKMPGAAAAGALALTTGGDGAPPGANEIVGSEALGSGMHALENTDFTLLCLPSIANQKGTSTDSLPGGAAGYPTIIGNAIAYCQKKRAMLLLDPPDNQTSTTAIQSWVAANSAIRDEYSALYYPRVTVADPTQNYAPRSLGPCGTIAGLMARIDASRGVWKAPAGTEATLLGLSSLDDDLTDPQNGLLNPLAINCLRTFSAYGLVSWGGRTLAGADAASSDYKYVPIRRLANFLESSLYIGLKWVVFEPNDEPLWSQIRLNVGSFMQTLFTQGAFAGRTPRDAYVVKCDRSTTTPDDQAKGIVNVLVGFAPLRPAEFVILQIQQLAGQTQS